MIIFEQGFMCEVCLTESGHYCGYLYLPEGHELHGISYLHPFEVSPGVISNPGDLFKVHGGITYGELAANGDWVFGFDCAHYGDGKNKDAPGWKDAEYVKNELASFAGQIKEFGDRKLDHSILAMCVGEGIEGLSRKAIYSNIASTKKRREYFLGEAKALDGLYVLEFAKDSDEIVWGKFIG